MGKTSTTYYMFSRSDVRVVSGAPVKISTYTDFPVGAFLLLFSQDHFRSTFGGISRGVVGKLSRALKKGGLRAGRPCAQDG